MEVVTGWTHKAFPVDDPSRVGEARRHAAQLAMELGFSEVDAGRLALVVTELGTNLHRHAVKGRLLIAARPAFGDVEVLAVDAGPGIPDLAHAMRDGQSSGSTPGTGMGAIRRLADDFDLHSSVPDGTVCLARVRMPRAGAAPAAVMLGAIRLPAPGENVCGDAWAACIEGTLVRLLVADGLGHGPEAAKASQAATAAFLTGPPDPREALQNVHLALQTTRGAAVCVMALDTRLGTLAYSGAGNIAGRLLSGVFDKSIITQHGTAGIQIRRPEATSVDLPPHALLIAHSDGLETRWKGERLLPVLRSDPGLVAALLWRDHTRHRDDATVVVLRRKD